MLHPFTNVYNEALVTEQNKNGMKLELDIWGLGMGLESWTQVFGEQNKMKWNQIPNLAVWLTGMEWN